MRYGLITIMMMIAAVGVSFSMVGCTQNASERRSASPTMMERIKQDSITGRVNDLGAKHVSIKDDAGETTRVRVDDQTKMDQVALGDQVKAFVSDDGYASTIQRVSP
jgi:Cu/Ag efflux protein CusF